MTTGTDTKVPLALQVAGCEKTVLVYADIPLQTDHSEGMVAISCLGLCAGAVARSSWHFLFPRTEPDALSGCLHISAGFIEMSPFVEHKLCGLYRGDFALE